jgi:hypothetical protein
MSQDWRSLVTLLPDEKAIVEKQGELYIRGEMREGAVHDPLDGTIILTDKRIIGLINKTKSKHFWSSNKVFLGYVRVYFEINLEDIDSYRTLKTLRGYILAISKKPRLYSDEIFDVGFGQRSIKGGELQSLNGIYRELSAAILESREDVSAGC